MTGIASDRSDEILSAIRQFMRTRQSSPTVREIGELVAIPSTSQVNYYLRKLENQGRI